MGDSTLKGYRKGDLEDAWLRYIPAQDPRIESKHPKHRLNHAENRESSTRNTGGDVSGSESPENPRHIRDVSDVSGCGGGSGDGEPFGGLLDDDLDRALGGGGVR
jgi:hypothetical protein